MVNFDDPDYFERKELVDLLKFNIDTRFPNHFIDKDGYEGEDSEELDWNLFDVWKGVSNKHLIDHEYRYRFMSDENAYVNQNAWEDEMTEIRRGKNNADKWIEEARREFSALIKVFYCRIATDADYPKHYPLGNYTIDQIQRASNRDAMLLKEITPAIQDKIFIKIVREKWVDMVLKKTEKFIVRTNRLVGFSGGVECTCLLFKVECVKQLVHAYPIRENEINYNYMEYAIDEMILYEDVNKDLIEPYTGNNMTEYNF